MILDTPNFLSPEGLPLPPRTEIFQDQDGYHFQWFCPYCQTWVTHRVDREFLRYAQSRALFNDALDQSMGRMEQLVAEHCLPHLQEFSSLPELEELCRVEEIK